MIGSRRYIYLATASVVLLLAALYVLNKQKTNNKKNPSDTKPEAVSNSDNDDEDKVSKDKKPSEENEGKHKNHLSIHFKDFEDLGGDVTKAGTDQLKITIPLLGELKVDGNRSALVYSRFPGIVKEVLVDVGTNVRKGQVLAIVEGNESMARFELVSPIDGRVLTRTLALGQVIKDDSESFAISDLRTLWLDLNAYSGDLSKLSVGQRIESSGNPPFEGKLAYISADLSGSSRSALVRATIENKSLTLKPGSFIEARVIVDEFKALVAVKNNAIQVINEQTCVFIPVTDGFETRKVRVGRSDDTNTEIVDGLSPGTSYVSKGAIVLKSELMKTDDDD